MIDYVLIGTIAALYVLGTFQAQTIIEEAENYLPDDMQISDTGKFFLKWMWPIATIKVLWYSSQEDNNE